MTFTFIGDLSTDLDIVRFEILDTVEGAGIKPNNGNYSDEEINAILAQEESTGGAIARLYANIAALYAKFVDSKIGPRDEKLSQAAARYAALAKQWRSDYPPIGVGVTTGVIDFAIDEDEDSLNALSTVDTED